jgi:hypothetical protein
MLQYILLSIWSIIFIFINIESSFSQRATLVVNYEPSYTSLFLKNEDPKEDVKGSYGQVFGLGVKYPIKEDKLIFSLILSYNLESYNHNISGLISATDIINGTESRIDGPVQVDRISIPSIGIEGYHKFWILSFQTSLLKALNVEENHTLIRGTGTSIDLNEVEYSYSPFNIFLDLGVGFRKQLNDSLTTYFLIKGGYNLYPEELYLFRTRANMYRVGCSLGLSFTKLI